MSISEAAEAAQVWGSVADSFKGMLTDLRYTSSNPADAVERLESIGAWLDSNPITATNAEEVASMWEMYLSTAQEAYQRPSAEYQAIYRESIDALESLEAYSRDMEQEMLNVAESQEALLTSINSSIGTLASQGITSILTALEALGEFESGGDAYSGPSSIYDMTSDQQAQYNQQMLSTHAGWFASTPQGTTLDWASGTITRGYGDEAIYIDPNGQVHVFDRYTPIADLISMSPYILAEFASLYGLTKEQLEKYTFSGYALGTDRVPETGPYTLHKDEAVLNPQDAEDYRQGKMGGGLTIQLGGVNVSGMDRKTVIRIVDEEATAFGSKLNNRFKKIAQRA